MQEAVYKPKRIVKVAGSTSSDKVDGRWAYLIDFLKNGKDDKDEPLVTIHDPLSSGGQAQVFHPLPALFAGMIAFHAQC